LEISKKLFGLKSVNFEQKTDRIFLPLLCELEERAGERRRSYSTAEKD
jgi:hypothetical protein